MEARRRAPQLEHHWLEEAQHTRLDFLETQKLLAQAPETLKAAMTEYSELLQALRATLDAQLELDLQTFEKAAGRTFTEVERADLLHAPGGSPGARRGLSTHLNGATRCTKAYSWLF